MTQMVPLDEDILARLRELRKDENETPSETLRRSLPKGEPVGGIRASELRRMMDEPGGVLGVSEEGLRAMEEAVEWGRRPARDPWSS